MLLFRSSGLITGKVAFLINLLSQVSVIVAQMIISLLLTPIVLERMGAEAYGFVGLVNNFVSYASVVTTALNSLAGRYITLAHHRGDAEGAERYYSSVFFANCALSAVVMALALALAANIEQLVVVSANLVFDLRLLILLAFLNASISLIVVVFGVAAFIKNQLWLNSCAQLISSVIRAVTLFLMFTVSDPHMWYYGASAVAASGVFFILQVIASRRVAPEYKILVERFSLSSVVEIVKSGIWSSVESINKLLLTGLDLLISNLFVGSYEMGILSIAKTIPSALTSVSANLSNLFYPKCAELYARGLRGELVIQFSFAMRFIGAVMMVPLVGLIVYGIHFYRLWLPGREDAELTLIQLLSVLTVLSLVASALVEPLYYANTLTNRIKESVLITFGFSISAVVIEFGLLTLSKHNGLIVIASVSSIVMSARHCVIQPLFAAKALRVPRMCFIRPLLREVSGLLVLMATFVLLDLVLPFGSWGQFLGSCILSALVGWSELLLVLLNKEERLHVLRTLARRRR